jgi:monoamine oxidase
MNNTIIVGAGIAGLYAAYQFQKKYPNSKVEIFEKENCIGGRLHSVKSADGGFVDLGAARFDIKRHALVKNIVNECGLLINDYPYSVEGKGSNLLQELQLLKNDNVSKDTQSFFNLIKNKKGQVYLKNMIATLGYDVLKNPSLSVNEAYRILDCHPELLNEQCIKNNWKRLEDGFYSLAHKLYSHLQKENIPVNLSHELLSIEKIQSSYHLQFYHLGQFKSIVCANLILALPVAALKKIQTNITQVNIANEHIATVSLYKLFLTFEDNWWKNLKYADVHYMTTDGPLRRLYFNSKQKQIFIYLDSEHAENLNHLFSHSGAFSAIRFLRNQLTEITGISDIPAPCELHHRFWSNGVSFWKLDCDKETLSKQFIAGEDNFALLSDMFSTNSGWVEGALQNVEYWLASI